MIKAVIFDMDGLMIDTEPYHQISFDKALSEYGKNLSIEENNKWYVGLSDHDVAEDIVARFNLDIAPEDLMKSKKVYYTELLKEKIIPQPGLFELVEQLTNNKYKLAVASGSRRDEIELVLESLTLTQFFPVYCSVEEVEKGKPEPDLFLYTAKKLFVRPDECLVLEDSPPGVAAAVAAGMKCFAIPCRETLDKDFSNALMRLNNLSEVYAHIAPLT